MDETNKILGKIFGTLARAKVLRFFMQNTATTYTAGDIALHTALTPAVAAREALGLRAAGVLRRKMVATRLKNGKKGKRVVAWALNDKLPYRAALEEFFSDALALDSPAIISLILRIGRIKYVVLSGIFNGMPDARVDILIVGDLPRPPMLSRTVRTIENGICRELKVAYLPTGDFAYRRNVNDKLLRDVFDYPHTISVDRLHTGG